MKIAFDIDGVLTNIGNFQLRYGQKFFKNNYNMDIVNENGFDIKDIFDCTDEQRIAFWKKYLLVYCITEPVRPGVKKAIDAVRAKGHKVYIITSREFSAENSKKGNLMRFIVEQWLKLNGISYDDIEYCDGDKKEAIIKHNIDIMVEDNQKNIKELSEITKVICMNNNYNSNITFNSNVERMDHFNELNNIIDRVSENDVKMHTETPNLTNIPSIDMPYSQFYTKEQLNITLPKKTIYQNLYTNNITNLKGIAINYFNNKISFSDLFHKIDDCCKAFWNLGVRENDIVAICMPNTPEAVIAFYALNKIGAVSNMIHPLKSANEIKNFLNETNSKYLISLDVNYEKIKMIKKETNLDKIIIASAKDSMPLFTQIGYFYTSLKEDPFYTDKNIPDDYIKWNDFIKGGKGLSYKVSSYVPNQLAVIIHTGGTTGLPKGVMLSNDNFNSMITQFLATADNFSKGDRMLTIMPIFHGFGLCSSIHLPLSFGVTAILIPKFESKSFYKILKTYRPNHIIGVPTLWRAMINNKKIAKLDLSYIKYVVTGGDSMSEEFERDINKFLFDHGAKSKLYKGYGLSEAVAGATFAFGSCNELGSIGIPMVKTNFKIVEPGTTNEVGYNQKGELCINGPTVMLGYYNNKKETDKVLKYHSDGKQWLHTGDMGYMTEKGILYYSERLTRMFISSGVNVYPEIIESLINKINGVEACAVIGIDDDYKGKVPKLYIVLNSEVISNDYVLSQIKMICKTNLDIYHQPRIIEIIDKLPITNIGENIGKINYHQLELDSIENNNLPKQKIIKLN